MESSQQLSETGRAGVSKPILEMWTKRLRRLYDLLMSTQQMNFSKYYMCLLPYHTPACHVKGQSFLSFAFDIALRILLLEFSLRNFISGTVFRGHPTSLVCVLGGNTWPWKIVLTRSFDKMEFSEVNCSLNRWKMPFTSSSVFSVFPLAQLEGSRQSSPTESKWNFYFCLRSALQLAVSGLARGPWWRYHQKEQQKFLKVVRHQPNPLSLSLDSFASAEGINHLRPAFLPPYT